MLDGCDAMDIQWKDTLELILLVGPFTTWETSQGICQDGDFHIPVRDFN
jgi:hypothetical protein